ncbi:MAG: hypothetical protein ABIM30_01255 [candidate division WOR-3 bacterium]
MKSYLFSLENKGIDLSHKLPMMRNIIPAIGVYKGQTEKSFLAVNPSEEQLDLIKKLMEESRQESYIVLTDDDIRLVDASGNILATTTKYQFVENIDEVTGDSYTIFNDFILEIFF